MDLADLCARTGVTVRTVRYYVQQGLLPSPGTGPHARYQQEHLDRLRLIRQLQKAHLPLVEIRRRLEGLDLRGVQALLHSSSVTTTVAAPPAAPTAAAVGDAAVDYVRAVLAGVTPPPLSSSASPSSPPPPPSPPSPAPAMANVVAVRSPWERISLGPDLELHVRRPQSRDDNRRVERIIEAALRILNEP